MKRMIKIIVLFITSFVLALITIFYLSFERSSSILPEYVDTQESDEREMYMTRDDIIEVFYNNYDAFSKVAEYILNTKELYSLIDGGQKAGTHDENGRYLELDFDPDSYGIGEQIRQLFSCGFDSIFRDVTNTRVMFSVQYYDPPLETDVPGSRGVIYVPGGLKSIQPQDVLDKENWYYYFLRYD